MNIGGKRANGGLTESTLGFCSTGPLFHRYSRLGQTSKVNFCEIVVTVHSLEHLFNCSAHPTQLTVQDLWDNPAEVADFLNLDS